MRAWRFVEPGKALVREELPDPEPSAGEVAVAIRAAGLCHSDLHIVDGDFPSPAPLTLGHEGAGEVAAVGDGVTNYRPGDRVAVYGAVPCGRCAQCDAGQGNICPNRNHTGIQVDGAFADQILVPAAALVPMPDGVSFEAAAVCVDAVLTPYHALTEIALIRPGERVGIVGLGGLGSNAVQIAAHLGAHVVAIDIDEDKREAALSAGAKEARADVPVTMDLDALIDFVGAETTLEPAQWSVRIGGRVVVVGLASRTSSLVALRLVAHQTSLLGSYWGTPQGLAACLQLVAEGHVKPVIDTQPLDHVNAQLDRLRRGQVPGRVVLIP